MAKLVKTSNKTLNQISGGNTQGSENSYKYHIVCKSCDQSVERFDDLRVAENVCEHMNNNPKERCSKCYTLYNRYYVCTTRGDQ